jgi:tetratricopeptide (TPR) repeat protein
MIHYHHRHKKITVIFIFSILLLVGGCDEEDNYKKHLQKGAEYINKGEYEKAKLEIKSSTQSGKDTAETYYYMALLDEKNRHFKEMKGNLLKTVELAPNYIDARLKLGKVQLLFGETDNAMEQAKFVLKEADQNIEALLLKASVLIRQKKQAEALIIIDNILKEKSDQTDALSLKALIYMENGDSKKALMLIDAAKKSDINNIGLDFFKIQIDAKTKNINAVLVDYENLVAAHPENKEFKITLAKIYVQADKTKEAEALLQGLIETEPNNVQNKFLLLDFLSAIAKQKVDKQFQQFTEYHKDQPRILLELSNWMITRRNFKTAEITLNRVIELEENSIVGLSAKMLLAKMAFDTKNFEKSQKIVNEILKVNSSYDDAKVLQARLLLINEQYDEAITLLKKVIWSKEDSEEANLLLAQTFLIKGDQKQADKLFLNVLSVNPANPQALTYLYDKAIKAKDIKSGKAMIEKALSIRPDDIVFLEKLADINLTEHDWDGAKTTIHKITNSPNPLANDVASYLLAQVFQGQGDYVNAIEIYKQLLIKFPENSDALGNMARCYEKLNKRTEMIVFLDTLLAKNSKNISAGILQSDLLLMNKDFNKATGLLTTLIKENSKVPQLYVSLANIKLTQSDNSDVIAIYREGLKQNPGNIKLSLSLGSLYEVQGKYEDAILIYETLLTNNPELDIVTNNLATVLSEHYTDNAQLKKAVDLTEKFKDSAQPYYKDTYAWALIKQGKISEGLKLLSELIVSSPDIPVFRYHLGVAHYKNGNASLAINEIKQAIELADKTGYFSDKKQAEKLLAEIIAKTRGY